MPDPLSRREHPDYFPCLNAFRAIGAVAVIATHVGFQTARTLHGPLAASIARMDVGVAVFFVLSGFLLARGFVRRPGAPVRRVDDRAYLWRRFLRIVPAYWVTVVVCLLVLPQNQGASPWDWLRNLTLTQIYSTAPQSYGLAQTWSLCTEVAFYLILPVIAATVLQVREASARLGLAVLVGGTAVSLAWLLSVSADGPLVPQIAGQWLPAFGSWFGVGMALAVWSVAAEKSRPGLRWVTELARSPLTSWAVAGSAFVVATSSLAGPRSLEAPPTGSSLLVKNLVYAVVAGFLILPFVFGDRVQGPVGAVLASRPLRALGEISYSMFLWHLLVLEVVVRLLHQPLFTGSFTETFLLTLAGTLVLATASYWVIERPLFRLRHTLPRRARAVTSAQESAPVTSS